MSLVVGVVVGDDEHGVQSDNDYNQHDHDHDRKVDEHGTNDGTEVHGHDAAAAAAPAPDADADADAAAAVAMGRTYRNGPSSPLVAVSSRKAGKGRNPANSSSGRSSAASRERGAGRAGWPASSSSSSSASLDVSGHAGSVNLGNTCFLNAVLQAASVTVPLQELLEHQWALSRHSASAVSGRADNGDEQEDSSDDGANADDDLHRRRRRVAAAKGKAKAREANVTMPEIPIGTREAPLSDALRTHLARAWSHQPPAASSSKVPASPTTRKKNSFSGSSATALNPRPLLNALARKFDQYGDFAQQDAHELLRHLLDACRMEEVDLIKKAQAQRKLEAEQAAAKTVTEEGISHAAASSGPGGSVQNGIEDDRPVSTSSRRPVLVRPSPIPAHLRPDTVLHDSSSDAEDSDTPILLAGQHLPGSGELTPMPGGANNPSHAFFAAPRPTHSKPSKREDDTRPDEPQLRPLIDVVFGGQLASIIVCESCRNIRHTYEDFYDLSLPLRDERGSKVSDKFRKRDRIRSMAELWRRAGTTSGSSSSANDARAFIAKSQLAQDEADHRSVMGKRRGSVAAMSETDLSEAEAGPGLLERRRQRAEAKRRSTLLAATDKSSAAHADLSANEDKAKAFNASSASKSMFRTGSIRRSLGHMSRSSKDSILSAHAADGNGDSSSAPGTNDDVVEGLERAVASMSVTSVPSSAHPSPSVEAEAAVARPLSPQHTAPPLSSTTTSPAIFSFWRSARSSSKSPAPSTTSAGFSLIDSPDFRSRSASPHRAAGLMSKDPLMRPASAVPDQAHLAPPPAHAHAISASHLHEAAHHDASSLHHVPTAPAALSAAGDISRPPTSSGSFMSPMTSLLSRTKATPSSSFTPSSSTQTSPAVLATRFADGTKMQGARAIGRFGRVPRRGPSRQAQYLAKILADVTPAPADQDGPGALLSAVVESPSVALPDEDKMETTTLPSAAAALLHRVNGTNPGNIPSRATDVPSASEIIATEFETGLGRALCQFTKVELLEGENAFKCRRCWRIAHPRTVQDRQRRRERRRQRQLHTAVSDKSTKSDSEDDDARDSSETPSSDLDTSDEDVDAVLELPPSLQRPALTRSNLQMDANKLAQSPQSSRRSSIDSDALEVMGASILSAPGKLGEAASHPQRLLPSITPLPGIPSIQTTAAGVSNEAVGQKEPHFTSDTPEQDANGIKNAFTAGGTAMQRSSSGEQRSTTASTASFSPRESIESFKHAVSGRSDDEPGNGATTRPVKRNFGLDVKNKLDVPATAAHNGSKSSSDAASSTGGERVVSAPSSSQGRAKKQKKATEAIERRALKRYLIAYAPPVLVFHFKRFQSNSSSRFTGRRARPGDFSKIDDPVTFPEYLDISPWMAPLREEYNRRGALKATSDPAVLEMARQEEMAGLSRSAPHVPRVPPYRASKSPFRFATAHTPEHGAASTPTQERFAGHHRSFESVKSRPSSIYGLYAVINHQGTMSGGHYTAYVLTDRVRSSSRARAVGNADTTANSTVAPNQAARSPSTRAHSRQVSSTSTADIDQSPAGDESMPNVSSSKEATDPEPQDGGVQPRDASSTLDANMDDEPAAPSRSAHQAPERHWVHVSDATVRSATTDEVFSSKHVYMLFYERL